MNELSERPTATQADFLSGGGEMAALIGATDWSRTSLGPIDGWPQSLRMAVCLCLASSFPINLIWGPDYSQIYNDGYRIICGDAHPAAFGESYTKTWKSAWPVIGGPFQRALSGETSFLENQRMFLFRNGYVEETFFTFALSPIREDNGSIGGLFNPVTETTATALAERRARMLRDLNEQVAEARTTADVHARALDILGACAADLPFVLLYELAADGGAYDLVGCVGVAKTVPPSSLTPEVETPLPVRTLCDTRAKLLLDDVATWLGGAPCGPYDEPPRAAFAFPLVLPGVALPAALLIAGVSPRLPLNDPYRDFFSLVAATLAARLANARSYEEERKRADLLATLDQAKTAFFLDVSHEFRTPLTLMLGPIEDALDDPAGLPPVQRERLTAAQRNAQRLHKLVNSLLDFSRIEAGRLQATFEPVDLAALTRDIASSFRSACERAGLVLVVDCAKLREPVYVDRDMWEKIVLNLVSNAFKFTLEGRIEVCLWSIDGGADLVVRDTGLGIEAAELPSVFERFHRAANQNGRTHEGSGIGLALVAELVRLHGGVVSAQSQPGRGSSFHVSMKFGNAHLPAGRIAAVRTAMPPAARANVFVGEALRWLPDNGWTRRETQEAAVPVDGRPRVVLAEDNADMRGYVARLLEAGGYAVTAVANGRAVLETTAQGALPDLVLSDVVMPILDGFGMLAALRADPRRKDLLVILLSARAGEEARVEGLAAEADDYLVKPFSARELRARVDGAVRLGRQRRAAAAREVDLRGEIAVAQGAAALRQSEQQLEFALHAARMGSWNIDIADRTITCSDTCLALFGLNPQDGQPPLDYFRTLLHPDDAQVWEDAVRTAAVAAADIDSEYRVVRPDGQVRWMLTRGRSAIHNGRPVRIAGVTLDITDRKEAEARQRMLLDELNHRVKNTLAVVQSIAMLSLLGNDSHEMPNEIFIGRIHALGRAHDLLTEAKWHGASLLDVIRRTSELFGGGSETERIAMSGPMVSLGPNAAVTLHMAFHELAINAMKYGGLSTQAGRVDIAWAATQSKPGMIDIQWRESGGPPVAAPTRRGFGTSLIEKGLTREMNGEAKLVFLPEGLQCHMRLPLSAKLSLAA